jgi:hypothetical protein
MAATYTRIIHETKDGKIVTITETMVEIAPHCAVNLGAARWLRLVKDAAP